MAKLHPLFHIQRPAKGVFLGGGGGVSAQHALSLCHPEVCDLKMVVRLFFGLLKHCPKLTLLVC